MAHLARCSVLPLRMRVPAAARVGLNSSALRFLHSAATARAASALSAAASQSLQQHQQRQQQTFQSFRTQLRTYSSRGRGDVDSGEDLIDDTQFHSRADAALGHLYEILDTADLQSVDDIELEDGVLNLQLESGAAFVINKHYATKQIWYASPVSGALYFSPGPEEGWICQADGRTLEAVFKEDFGKLCPEGAGLKFGSE
mmetsp:Transcript_30131/g.65116  ORF Transcript_30131/g.65116 Transcript_30131/m.65116 type:complete len:200 (+) Transcript_30131:101-700(+)